nr:sigma-70 family RNA polymerase sigma factor [Patulibacter sp.]
GGSIGLPEPAGDQGERRTRPTVEPATGPDVVHDEATRARLGELLSRIDENKREVVVLSVAGHSADEIAARLDLTRANVYQLRKRGLDQLRSALEDES